MKYDAFISYRHLPRDMFVAKGIHKALETTKIPLRIRKELGKKGIQRVFRDQEELPIGSSLSDNIEAALAESEFLVVICTPQTKESAWVMKEINTFIAMHGRQNVLAVLAEGEPADAFPPQLLYDDYGNPREPLAADVRGNSQGEIRKKIKSESLRLAASILYCDYDTLKQRHRERVMRRYMGIAAGVAALGVVFGIYNAYNLARINENYQQKLTNESKVLAATSQQVLEGGDRKTAALIALEALPTEGNERPFVADAMYALSDALGTYSIGWDLKMDKVLLHDVAVDEFSVNSDLSRVISYDQNESVYYWDVKSGDLLFKIDSVYYEGQAERIKAVAINDAAKAVISEHYFTGYDDEGNKLYEHHFSDDYALFAGFSQSGNYLGVCFRNTAAVYDARTGELVRSFDDDDVLYSSEIMFSTDDKLFGIEADMAGASLADSFDSETSHYLVYDLETGKRTDFEVAKEAILDVRITPDDQIAIASTTMDSLIKSGENFDTIQKYDRRTGKELWSTDVIRYHRGLDTSYTYIKGRVLDTSNGKRGELLVSSSRNLYTLDLYTGELLTTYAADDDIVNYGISMADETIYVAMANGKINVVDGATGYNYADNTIDTGDSLTTIKMGGGIVIGSRYRSPEIGVMSAVEDDTKENVLLADSTIYTVMISPDSSKYGYTCKSSYSSNSTEVFVFDSATDEVITHVTLDDVISMDIEFLDNDTLVIASSSKGLAFVDIESGDMVEVPGSDEHGPDFLVSGDRKVILASYAREFHRYDAVNHKLMDEGEYIDGYGTGYYNNGVLNEKGDKVFYWDLYGCLYSYDFETKEFEQLFENYIVKSAALNKDLSKIVIQCGDGFARVFDVASMKMLDEVSFFGESDSYLGFSDDGTKLYMQSSDNYFKIYDLEKDEYIFVSDGMWGDAADVREIPEKNLLIFVNTSSMTMIDLESYGILGRAEYGALYFQDTDKIISIKSNEMYRFKVKTLEDLVSEAKEKYGDAKLTSDQRLKYKLY